MNKLLKEAEKYTIYTTLFLLPLAFSPMFFNAFQTTKLTVLVLGVVLALVFRILRATTGNGFEFSFKQGSFDLPVFIIGLAYLLSGIYVSPNKMEAFFLPGVATIMIASAVLYFLVNQLEHQEKERVIPIIIASSFFASIMYLLALSGLFEGVSSMPAFMRSKSFTPQGALLPTALILVTSLIYSAGFIKSSRDYLAKVMAACAAAIIAICLLLATFNMVTSRENFRLATFDSSFAVAFDSLKNSALMGIGPSNYLTAYTRFRPISTNMSDDWQARYSHARNFYLTAVTETGFIGTFALILLVLVVAKMVNKEIKSREDQKLPLIDAKIAAIFVLFVLLALFPATSPEILVLVFVSLALGSKTHNLNFGFARSLQFSDNKNSKAPGIILATPFLLGLVALLVIGGRTLGAERTYKVALDQIANNKGTDAYQTLQSAINASPNVDRYHATYSQINFLLAEAVARKEEITDADRQTITKLIEQSIREAKATVALNPTRAGNWEILANTYKNVMTLSKDAGTYAIQSYSQAVALDPVNPNLRIALGGVWYAVKNYENAVDTFKLAAIAKPDHANARYNLALAYRERGDTERAIAELKEVLKIVKTDSKDYETAKKELDALESKKASTAGSGESLTPPATNEPIITPEIDLNEDAAPEVSPTPTPSATPVASPTTTPTN